MFCKWCGMESTSTDKCSWCNKTLTADSSAEQVSQQKSDAAIQIAEENKSALNTEVIEENILPIAPWTISPPETAAPEPSAPIAAASVPDGSAPIIGIRKQRNALGGLPAPARRPVGSPVPPTREGVRPGAHTPAPAAPLGQPVRRSAAPLQTSAGTPAVSVSQPISSNGSAAQSEVSRSASAKLNSPAAMPTIAMPAAATAAPIIDPSAPGLAEGVAAPSRVETAPEYHAPEFGTFTPTKSKYYSGTVVDPYSGAHYDADTGSLLAAPGIDSKQSHSGQPIIPTDARNAARRTAADIQLNWDKPRPPMSTLLMKYSAIFAGILAVSSLAAHTMPRNYVLPLIVSQFLGAMLLPIVQITPWAEEDTDDLGLYILLILAAAFAILCGPFVALAIYIIISLVRQNTNPSVIGCLAVASIARLVMEVAASGWSHALFTPLGSAFNLKLLFISWTGLVPLAGLYTASIFRKLDE